MSIDAIVPIAPCVDLTNETIVATLFGQLEHCQNQYSASVILKELATEESLDPSRRSFTSCLGSG